MKTLFLLLSLFVYANSFADNQKNAPDKKHSEQHVEHIKIEGCCKVCKTDKSKPCGNSCIPIGEECGKGKGCACTSDGKHELEEKPIWVAPK